MVPKRHRFSAWCYAWQCNYVCEAWYLAFLMHWSYIPAPSLKLFAKFSNKCACLERVQFPRKSRRFQRYKHGKKWAPERQTGPPKGCEIPDLNCILLYGGETARSLQLLDSGKLPIFRLVFLPLKMRFGHLMLRSVVQDWRFVRSRRRQSQVGQVSARNQSLVCRSIGNRERCSLNQVFQKISDLIVISINLWKHQLFEHAVSQERGGPRGFQDVQGRGHEDDGGGNHPGQHFSVS